MAYNIRKLLNSKMSSNLESGPILLTAALILQSVSNIVGLTCYQCTIRPPQSSNQTSKLCSQFDYSRKYIVDCPYSTFCMKKTFNLPLLDGKSVEISVRDCAPQKYIQQTYLDGKWKMEESVQKDVYTTGCQETDNSAGLRTNSELYCYCDRNLCNSAQSHRDSFSHTDVMTVIVVFNIVKYIRSIS